MTARAKAIAEGRAFIRVRNVRTGAYAVVGVCPGCWATPARRAALLAKIVRRGLAVVHAEDGATGVHGLDPAHAPLCPYRSREEEEKKDEP